MTTQLKQMILGRRSGTLREAAKPISNGPAVVRRGCLAVGHPLPDPRALRHGGCDFGGRPRAVLVVVMALLAVAVTAPAASADPVGQISEFSTGLNVHSNPLDVVSGSDGNLWFTAPQPATTPLPIPALSALDITPRMFSPTERRVGGRCRQSSRFNRREHPCIRRGVLRVRSTLSAAAAVTLTIERTLRGRLTRGRTVPTRSDRLLATPTAGRIAGQQQATVEIIR